MLPGKTGKTFLVQFARGQMVQFDTIKFCSTLKNYFGQFVWIEKSHYNSRVSLHEAPTKNKRNVPLEVATENRTHSNLAPDAYHTATPCYHGSET